VRRAATSLSPGDVTGKPGRRLIVLGQYLGRRENYYREAPRPALYRLPSLACSRTRGCRERSLCRSRNGNRHVATENIAARSRAYPGGRRLRWRERAGDVRGLGGDCVSSADRVAFGEPRVCRERQSFDAHLVLDRRELVYRLGRVVGSQGDFRQSDDRRTHREQQLLPYL